MLLMKNKICHLNLTGNPWCKKLQNISLLHFHDFECILFMLLLALKIHIQHNIDYKVFKCCFQKIVIVTQPSLTTIPLC